MKYDKKRTIFGITLTKRAWNNILIYAVLLLMFLLYYATPTADKRTAPANDSETIIGLIPTEMQLQQIVIDNQTLEHERNDWRCRQPCSLSKQQAENIASAWLSLRMQAVSIEPTAKVVDVFLYFANDQTARIEVFSEPQLLLRLPQQQRVFAPQNVSIESLLGR